MKLNKFLKISIKSAIPLLLLSTFYFLLSSDIPFAQGSQLNLTYPWSGATTPGGFVASFYRIALGLVGAAALGAIIYGAILYAVSAGNPSKQGEAKTWIWSAIWGLILLLAAYIILYTINPALVDIGGTQNFLDSLIKPVSVGQAPVFTLQQSAQQFESLTGLPASYAGIGPGGTLTEAQAESLLASAASMCIPTPQNSNCLGGTPSSLPVCASGQSTGCVSFEGIKVATLNEVAYIAGLVGNSNVFITGGTEAGHNSGSFSHSNGYKVDLRLNPTLDSYITTNFTYIGVRSDGAPMYRSLTGAVYAKEGNHWDVSAVSG